MYQNKTFVLKLVGFVCFLAVFLFSVAKSFAISKNETFTIVKNSLWYKGVGQSNSYEDSYFPEHLNYLKEEKGEKDELPEELIRALVRKEIFQEI